MSKGKVVITRAEEVKPSRFPWGAVRWLCHGRLAADAEMTFGIVTILPGESLPAHSHENCEELMYLIRGELEHTVEDSATHVGPGTLVRIPRGACHSSANTGAENAVTITCYSAGVRKTRLDPAGDGRPSPESSASSSGQSP